jgi:hypothetical protein
MHSIIPDIPFHLLHYECNVNLNHISSFTLNSVLSKVAQLEQQQDANGKEMAVLETQFAEEKHKKEQQLRKRLEQRKAKGSQKAAEAKAAEEEAQREKEKLEREFEDKKKRLQEEQAQKDLERKREMEAEAERKVAEAKQKQAEAVTNLEKLKEAQALEIKSLQADMEKGADAANDRLQARLAKRRQKRKGGASEAATAGGPEDAGGKNADLQKKIEDIKKRQKIQEDEAIKKIQEATVTTAASNTAYEGFKQRLKAEVREATATQAVGATNVEVQQIHHSSYNDIIGDLFRLEDDTVMTQEEILVLEEFTRVAKKKLKLKR